MPTENKTPRYTFNGAAGEYVYAVDFDRVTAERDAQKEYADRADSVISGLQQRLTAADEELDQCQSMALMIEEKEWAEHVGSGPISSQVESAFTQLHNDLSEARQGLKAADLRIALLEGLLREWLENVEEGKDWVEYSGRVHGALNPACTHNYHLGECTKCRAISAAE
ncbi:hypothetical protein HX857_09805 [Pseudomonas gingeri]|uniref:hypothetical protein n=1 Tax=Pseudomonas gingeri TaxID=117681 RepID=UPI0015B81C94|nr:hypothetical protein [Pseudomonas gingeri]NWE69000.1 hypothetical protein [Pseudomonas gingeri]